jgi:hypothetical protein
VKLLDFLQEFANLVPQRHYDSLKRSFGHRFHELFPRQSEFHARLVELASDLSTRVSYRSVHFPLQRIRYLAIEIAVCLPIEHSPKLPPSLNKSSAFATISTTDSLGLRLLTQMPGWLCHILQFRRALWSGCGPMEQIRCQCALSRTYSIQ